MWWAGWAGVGPRHAADPTSAPHAQVPFLTTPRGGVDKSTLYYIKQLVSSGVSFRAAALRLAETQRAQLLNKGLIYYDFAKELRRVQTAARGAWWWSHSPPAPLGGHRRAGARHGDVPHPPSPSRPR
jgi:hypothetical protein